LQALDVLAKPRYEDFTWTSASPQKNRFGWVGNGWSKTEVDGGDTGTLSTPSYTSSTSFSPHFDFALFYRTLTLFLPYSLLPQLD
jgi:hypothetical protein